MKKTTSSLNRYRGELYIIKKTYKSKHFARVVHWRCRERIKRRQYEDIQRVQAMERGRLRADAVIDQPLSEVSDAESEVE